MNHDRDRQTLVIDDRHNLVIDDWWSKSWKTHKSLFAVILQKQTFEHFFRRLPSKVMWTNSFLTQKTCFLAVFVLTVFEQNFAFESFGLHFWESHWLTSNNNVQLDWKRYWEKNKNSEYCANCLRAKLRFWDLQAPFLRKQLIDIKQQWSKWLEKMLRNEEKQQILCPLSSSKTSLLRAFTFISEKMIDWHQRIIIKMIGKDVERRRKKSEYWAYCLRTKLHFWEFWPSYLRKLFIDIKQ